MTAGNWIIFIVACILSCAAGFAFMFWVAKAMVDKVRLQEERRHQDLLNITADHEALWQDALNDVIDVVRMGKLQNKSVPDQVKIVMDTIDHSQHAETEVVDLTKDERQD